jgi:ABC-type transport system involved in multi-copper enzyme maturation permease subunit
MFLSCGILFSQAFRGEIFEKTLHFYLLAPVRRSIIVAGKFLASLILIVAVFEICTVGSFLLFLFKNPEFRSFFMEGAGFSHLVRYAIATLLACSSYGAVFILIGLLFKNPGGPSAIFLLWESFNYVLPSMLQQVSVLHHLQSIFPVAINRGPFAVVTEPTSAILGVSGLLIGAAALLSIAGSVLNRTEVTYSAD